MFNMTPKSELHLDAEARAQPTSETVSARWVLRLFAVLIVTSWAGLVVSEMLGANYAIHMDHSIEALKYGAQTLVPAFLGAAGMDKLHAVNRRQAAALPPPDEERG